jgi:phage baseplate assembly protein W
MQIEFPYRFDGRRRTAEASEDDHVRDLIEQVLFTQPGERVNRPEFGSGLLQLTFAPLSDELVAATEFLIRGALEQWLGRLIRVEALAIQHEDGRLSVDVSYAIRRTGDQRSARFSRPAVPA